MMVKILTFADDWHKIKSDIAGVTADSRDVQAGYLFAMLPSTAVDGKHGREYLQQAIEQGASYLLAEAGEEIETDLPSFVSENIRRDIALMAVDFYASSAQGSVKMIAVTGTNGKSSIVWMLRHLWADAGIKGASIGTHGIYRGLIEMENSAGNLTTPDAVKISASDR